MAVPVCTLLELCGAASFSLNTEELALWLFSFAQVYRIKVLDPYPGGEALTIGHYLAELGKEYITRGMTFGDAALLREAEAYGAVAIVTWNPKHFRDRTRVPVLTPEEWLAGVAK